MLSVMMRIMSLMIRLRTTNGNVERHENSDDADHCGNEENNENKDNMITMIQRRPSDPGLRCP